MVITDMTDLIKAVKSNNNIVACIRETITDRIKKGCETELNLEIGAIFDEAISQNQDLEDFLEELKWCIAFPAGPQIGQKFVHLLEYTTGLTVVLPYENVPNRQGIDLVDETFYFFNNIQIV